MNLIGSGFRQPELTRREGTIQIRYMLQPKGIVPQDILVMTNRGHWLSPQNHATPLLDLGRHGRQECEWGHDGPTQSPMCP